MSGSRVLLVSYHFPPASTVGALRPGRLARILPESGFEVDVVCGSLGQAEGEEDASRRPLVPSGSRLLRVDVPFVLGRNPFEALVEHRPVRRAWWKTRAYLEWLFLNRDWAWKWGEAASQAASKLARERNYDVVLVDGPPNSSVLPVVRWAREVRIPSVLDLRDIWWEAMPHPPPFWWLHPRLRRLGRGSRWRDEAVRSSRHVVLTSPEMAEATRAWFPDLPPHHFSWVPNGFGEVDSEESDSEGPNRDRLRLVHTGSLAYGRMDQARALIRGLAELRRRGAPEVEAHFVGDSTGPLVFYAAEEGVADLVDVQGWVLAHRAKELQRGAGALLLLQPPGRIETRVAIPGKLFDYMARRRNVFGMVGPGPAARIITEHRLGVVASADDPRAIADALSELGERVRQRPFLLPPPEEFSERRTVEQFAGILRGVLGERSVRPNRREGPDPGPE